jgi:PAS domain S-box-containing protein
MAAERMFGFSGDELQRRDVSKLVEIGGAADRSFLDRIGASKGALNTGMVRQLTARRRDGQSFPVDVAFGPMELATGTHVVAVVRDVSERHRLDEMKSDFIATVSHELRTPLTSIVGALSLLASNSAGDLPSSAAKLIEIAHRNGQRLVRLINDVLSIQKIESGKLELDFGPVTLKDVAERSVEGISGMAYALGVSLELIAEDDGPVYADDERLIQVVTNLLSNACKYSPRGGTVTITVRRLQHFVRLSVRDRGPGIPIEFRSSIFSKFSQAHDAHSKSGTGLGLIIAREITEMNGGSLWFESEPGDGATFHVDLPLAVSRAGDGTEGPRVLVCEDEPARADSLVQLLDQDGFSVDVARTIEASIQLACQGDYAAALVDFNCDSKELIQALRSHSDTRHLPVILLSGDATEVNSAGGPLVVVDWLAEPMDPERLRAAVATSLATSCGQALVLHVEDDPDILELARATLAGVAKVIPAPSLARARIELARARPDIVILDLNLADGSGPDLLADLSDKKGRTIPVVIYSARDISPELAARVDAVLLKSKTSMDGLRLTVRRLIAKREAIRLAAA